MSYVFIVDLFYFQINKNINILLHQIKHFYRYARIYQTHDIENSACILHIQRNNNLYPFSILYNISILAF